MGQHRGILPRVSSGAGEASARLRFSTPITIMNAVFGRSWTTVDDGELRLLFAYEPAMLSPTP